MSPHKFLEKLRFAFFERQTSHILFASHPLGGYSPSLKMNDMLQFLGTDYIVRSIIISLFLLAGCAPGFGSKISAPIVTFKEEISSAAEFPQRIAVEAFLDRRQSPELVKINGRSIVADTGIGIAVQQGFEQAFKDTGSRLALFNVPKISGNIIEWHAEVGPKFPSSTITAKATIQLDAYNKEGKKVFNRKYFGEIEGKHPIMTEGRIRDLLGVAMGHAISTAVADVDLQRALK